MNYLTVHFALTRRGQLEAARPSSSTAPPAASARQPSSWPALGARVIAVVSSEDKIEVARAAGAHHIVLADGFLDARQGAHGAAASTSSSTRSAATASPTACAASPLRAGCSSSASPRARSPRSRSTGCCSTTSASSASAGAPTPSAGPATPGANGTELVPHLRSGALDPPIGARYPLEKAAEALTQIDERRVLGKIVLTV